MVKINNNEVEIIRKMDKQQFKRGYGYLIVAVVMNTINFFFAWKLALAIEVFGLIFLVLGAVFYKMTEKEKKVLSFSKDYLKIYKNNSVDTFETSSIDCFIFNPNSNSNMVYMTYKTAEGKTEKYRFLLTGMEAKEFVNMANYLMKDGFKFDNLQINGEEISTDEKADEEIKSEEDIESKLLAGEVIKVMFVGKTKILKQNGDIYYLERASDIIFSTCDGNLFYAYYRNIKGDLSNIKVGNIYTIERSKTKTKIVLKESEGDNFDINKINQSLKKELVEGTLTTNNEQIIDELRVEKNYDDNMRFFLSIFVGLFLATTFTLKIKSLYKVFMWGIFVMMIVFAIHTISYGKEKKKELMKYYK